MLLYIGLYIAMIIAFCCWDAFIGFDVEFDGSDQPPLFVAAVGWPLTIPLLFIGKFLDILQDVKFTRIEKQEKKFQEIEKQKKLRVALEYEEARCLEEVELEVSRYNKVSNLK